MSNDKKPLEFDGKGFSRDPLTPEELAEHRERSHHYDRNFLSAEKFVEEAGLKWLSNVAKGFPAFVKAFLVFGSLAGAYIALLKAGWLP